MDNVAEIENTISQEFDFCATMSSGLLRCERRYNGKPLSVSFFDTSGEIPATREELANYLDEKIAKSYFTCAPTDLRWNHYLVFVHDSNTAIPARQVIEDDSNYARKFLVDRIALPAFLKGYQPSGSEGLSEGDVFGRWAATLDEAGLHAIVDDQPRATLVHDYLQSDTESLNSPRPKASDQSHPEDAVYSCWLEELRVRSFLPFPPPRSYPFGRVNLIFGPNGVGKTSLLEAIEHFYCGSTLRNDLNPVWNADLQAKFRGVANSVSSETATESFRKRDLRWYGRNYDRKNKLAESFNRYNFYNSDAAYNFVYDERAESLKDALSRLALGDEANKLWDRVEKTLKLFEDEKRLIGNQLAELRNTEMSTARELEQAQKPSPIVESLFSRLVEHLKTFQWTKVPRSTDEVDSEFIKSFQLVLENLNLISRLTWMRGALTRTLLEGEYVARQKAFADLSEKQQLISDCRQLMAKLDSEYRQLINRREEMQQLKQYFDAEFDQLLNQVQYLQPAPQEIQLGIHVKAVLEDAPLLVENESIDILEGRIEKRRQLLQERMSILSKEIADTQKKAVQWESLVANIRALAVELVALETGRKECPVCRTQFESHALLETHVNQPGPQSTVDDLQGLIVQQQQDQLEMALLDSQGVYLGHCRRMNELGNVPSGTLDIAALKKIASEVVSAQEIKKRERRALEDQLIALQKVGMNADTFYALRSAFLADIGAEDPHVTEISTRLQSETAEVSRHISENQDALGVFRRRLEVLQKDWVIGASRWSPIASEEEVLNDIADKISSLESVLEGLTSAGFHLKMEPTKDIRENLLHAQITDDALKAFSEAIFSETKRNTRLAELGTAKLRTDRILLNVRARETRCERAIAAIKRIVESDTRDKAVDTFLARHHAEISEVFRRIHAPKEFLGLSKSGEALVCLDGKTERSFMEISTGQRSAVALAVFLTLNGMLRKAPPILIFDDPITAVDDLNILAFLDHLRDLAIGSKRQIFFSTANQKLASLFSKKFSFLGETEFKTFALSRSH
jgi:DNA repair exonuclease SbcCD ATPase subunit